MRNRQNRLTAVRVWNDATSRVFVLSGFSGASMERFLGANPEWFSGAAFRPLMHWRNKRRFFKWLSERQRNCIGWTYLDGTLE